MRYILCAMGVLFSICHVRAQDSAVVVESLKKSTNSVPVVDFWLFGSVCRMNAGYSYHDFEYMYDTYTNVGFRTEIYVYPKLRKFQQNGKLKKEDSPAKKLFAIRPSLAVGYKYDRIAYQADKTPNSGFYGHWLTLDANVKMMSVCLGASVDILLKQQIKLSDGFNYVGLDNPCINPVTSRWYLGLVGSTPFAEMELRIGWYFIPIINPDKYAYYNLNHFRSYGEYIEARMAFRIFSTGKRI